jgi:hypothetical protein
VRNQEALAVNLSTNSHLGTRCHRREASLFGVLLRRDRLLPVHHRKFRFAKVGVHNRNGVRRIREKDFDGAIDLVQLQPTNVFAIVAGSVALGRTDPEVTLELPPAGKERVGPAPTDSVLLQSVGLVRETDRLAGVAAGESTFTHQRISRRHEGARNINIAIQGSGGVARRLQPGGGSGGQATGGQNGEGTNGGEDPHGWTRVFTQSID